MDVRTLSPKQIDDKTIELLEAVFGDIRSIKFPIDLNRVVEFCGLTIRQGKFQDEDLEGALDRQSRTVYLSKEDSYERKNFTLAHEIGHFKLHEQVKTDIFTMHQLRNLLVRQGKDPKEDQADLFAASLLMPEQPTRSLWQASNKNVEMMSRIFGVPPIVARLRLKSLKLI